MTRTFQSYAGIVNVKDYGAAGDGVTNDTTAIQAAINAAFVVCTTNASDPPAGNRALYFPPGKYITTAPLTLNGTFGVTMFGSGRFTSQIFNTTSGSKVFTTNGCQYSKFYDMLLSCTGAGSQCFQLSWDGSTYCALQSNTFENMFFTGGDYGVTIGAGGYMGSENAFINCFFINCAEAGLATQCFNALNNSTFGGNFQGCGVGISVGAGAVSVFATGFQTSVNHDIEVYSSANDCMVIQGCRTESANFIYSARQNISIVGCYQTGSAGKFCETNSAFTSINGCTSVAGKIDIGSGGHVENTDIGLDDWYTDGSNFSFRNLQVGQTLVGSGTGTPQYLSEGFVDTTGLYVTKEGNLALVDGATINSDAFNDGNGATTFFVTIAGNRVLANPTNMVPGKTYSWLIEQGAGGSHTLTYGSKFSFSGGTPTLSTAAGAADALTGMFDGYRLRMDPLLALSPYYTNETQQYFNRLTTEPDSTHRAYYNTLISALVAAGIWAKLDGLYIFAAPDEAAARVNLISGIWTFGTPTSSLMVDSGGGQIFSAYAGINFNGDSWYPSFNFANCNSSNQISASDACCFVWSLTSGQHTGSAFSGSAQNLDIYPRYSDDKIYADALDNSDSGGGYATATGLKLTGASRFSLRRPRSTATAPQLGQRQIRPRRSVRMWISALAATTRLPSQAGAPA